MIKLLSIQTGSVQTHILSNGRTWTTGYVKTPVNGAVYAGKNRLEGDEQQHIRIHGGAHRAILGYSAAHYPLWEQEYGQTFDFGAFGENFTLESLTEDSVCLGDIYQVGDTVQVEVSQPRQPCNQIEKYLQIRGIEQRTRETLRTGWYMRVLQEGAVEAGMTLTRLARPYPEWTIRRAHEIRLNVSVDPQMALSLAACTALSPGWRTFLKKHATDLEPSS